MEEIDQKYNIEAVNNVTNIRHTSNDAVLFLCKDKLLPGMLFYYIERAKQAKCNKDFIKALTSLKKRVIEWQKENKDQVKIPD